jgi:hypothetical protein
MAGDSSPVLIAFGYSSFAGLTWESRNHCRTSLWSVPTPAATTWAVSAFSSANSRAPSDPGSHDGSS